MPLMVGIMYGKDMMRSLLIFALVENSLGREGTSFHFF